MLLRMTRRLLPCLSLLALLGAIPCLAGNGSVIQLPPPRVKNKSGLKLEIDSRAVNSNGYRPIKLKLTSSTLTPATYDRQVRVTMGFYGWGTVAQVLEIPEGATGAEKTISVPDSRCISYQLEVTEGGERLAELCQSLSMAGVFGGYGGDERFPALLFVNDHVPGRPERDNLIAASQAQVPDNSPTFALPD